LAFLSQNKKLFRDKYHIVRIGLFGSYARGEQNPNSDIDLLVEFEENPEIKQVTIGLSATTDGIIINST